MLGRMINKWDRKRLTLKNWYITETGGAIMQAHGNVYGHYRLEDGNHIYTSTITAVYYVNKEESFWVLETYSGSLYQLREEDMDVGRKGQTMEFLKREVVYTDNSIEERLETAEMEFLEKKKIRDEAFETAHDYAVQQMWNDELYLIIEHRKPIKVLYRYKNQIYELEPKFHFGIFQDSILIGDWMHGELDFRYFPNVQMECYFWSKNLKKVHFYNLGRHGFTFDYEGKSIFCEAGKVTMVTR